MKKLPLAMSIPFTLGGIPIRVMGDNSLTRMAKASDSDRVLIILQMHGGNDGLNSVIPIEAYDEYYAKRPNIAIPVKNSLRRAVNLDSTLPMNQQVGLHPDMLGMKSLYDTGRMSVVQGVSYKNNNGSHFRGRDIWFMGGSTEDYYQSGWVGRYLQQTYAPLQYPQDFPYKDVDNTPPDESMLDPLAIEMGNDVSLIFHQEGNIPTSISINSPVGFAELLKELEGFEDELLDPRGIPPEYLKDSPYYNELNWILSLEDKSKDYADRLAEVYKAGDKITGFRDYPETYPFNAPSGSLKNSLAWQLQIIAKLLSGGCKTKVFLVKIGGFDTHADQVEKYDPTMGAHAALMYHISSSMKAFQDDLRARGLEERVLTITTSEFGRRVKSNGSYGTDHGTASPMFIFGRYVQPGVLGDAWKITPSNNLEMQLDYRIVYANIMRTWMGVSDTDMNIIFPGLMTAEGTTDKVTFEEKDLVQKTITGAEGFVSSRFGLGDCYPNPAKTKTTFTFQVNTTNHVRIDLLNNAGVALRALVNDTYVPGEHQVEVDLHDLTPGTYVYTLKSGFYTETKKLVVIK